MSERCVVCGAEVPEGRQVCPACEKQPKLKRCPFCGAAAFMWRTNRGTIIECSLYDSAQHRVMVSGANDIKAAEQWNRRDADGAE